MEKIKLKFDIEQFKEIYDNLVYMKYAEIKQNRKYLRMWTTAEISLFLIAILLWLLFLVIWHSLLVLSSAICFVFVYIIWAVPLNKYKTFLSKKRQYVNAEYEEFKKFGFSVCCSECSSHEKAMLYRLLTDNLYILLKIIVAVDEDSLDRFTVTIYYEISNVVNEFTFMCLAEVRTDYNDVTLCLNSNDEHNDFTLCIPYGREKDLNPCCEYEVDISELLKDIDSAKGDKT